MSHEKTIRAFSRSIETGNAAGVCACFAPDGIYRDSIYGEHVGHQAIASLVSAVHAQAHDFKWTNHRIVVDGDVAMAEFTLSLRINDASDRPGRSVTVSGVISCQFKEGRIQDYREYMDVGLTLLALGYPDQAILEQLRERSRGQNVAAFASTAQRLHAGIGL